MDDIVFLYDQVIEHVVRLETFASVRGPADETHGDIRDDIDSVTLMLARRDLLVLAASMRNFIEITKGMKLAKATNITTSEIFISGGPPFFRDTKETITVYQCLSRVLHANYFRIFRDVSNYYSAVTTDPKEFFSRILAFEREGGDTSSYEEPLIAISTEQDKVTMLRLKYVLTGVCEVLGKLSDELSEKKIFLQRDYR